jgi:type III secretion protein J
MIIKRRALSVGLCLLLTGCNTPLSQNLDERQADDVVVTLEQQGIKAEKVRAKDGTWEVNVEHHADTSAEQIMQAYDLPRKNHPSLGEIFPGGSLLPSETEERIRYQYALSQELSATIEKIDGVLTARVQVAIPEKDPKRAIPAKPSASAMIRYRSDQRMDLLKPQLKALIADSLVDGDTGNVELLMVPVYPVSQSEALQEVKTHAGLRYRASEWVRVAVMTGLPWLAVFMLLLVLLRKMGRAEGHSWLESVTRSKEWFKQRRNGKKSSGASGSGGPSYAAKGLAGLAPRRTKPKATE